MLSRVGCHLTRSVDVRGCIGDRYCDRACKTDLCGWDAGDCGFDLIYGDLTGINITSQVSPVFAEIIS